jgi:hypothetical protein
MSPTHLMTQAPRHGSAQHWPPSSPCCGCQVAAATWAAHQQGGLGTLQQEVGGTTDHAKHNIDDQAA